MKIIIVMVGNRIARLPASKVEIFDKAYNFLRACREQGYKPPHAEVSYVTNHDDTVEFALREAGIIL